MKTFMFPTLAALLLAAALEGAFAADGPNLVVNGDFEAAGFTANYKENCGSAYLIGWECSKAGICTPQGTYLSTAIKTFDNSAWAFLKQASWFSQDIEVEAGPYRLEYDFCGRPGNFLNGADVTITFGDTVVTNFTGDGGSNSGSIVAHHVIDFRVAQAGTYALKFAQATTADKSPAFDNITLVSTIPQTLTVSGSPHLIGTVTPAYGLASTNANEALVCSAPATVVTPYASWTLAGWRYYEEGVLVNSGTTTSTNITVKANVYSKLEWLWTPATGGPVTVSTDGTGQYDSISEALAAFGEGDSEIVLLPGAYPVESTVVLDKPMTFRSSTGDWRDVTVYRKPGSANFPVFRIDAAGVVLSGISITNGHSTASNQGGAVYTTAAATIQDCRIAKNTGSCATVNLVDGSILRRCRVDENFTSSSSHHLGVYMAGASTVVEDCEIINNATGTSYDSNATALRIAGGTVRRCVVTNNFNTLGCYGHAGAISTEGACLIENCLVAGNTGSYGANFPKGTSNVAAGIHVNKTGCVIRNCTIADNMGTGRGGIRVAADGNLRLENSIVWGNIDIGNAIVRTGANASAALTDWNISNLSPRYATNVCSTIFFGEGSLATDPIFVDALHGDYRLAANSPCRNAGYARPGDDTATDLAGNARVVGDAIDIGCFEGTAAEPSVTLPDIRQDVYLTAGGDIFEALTHCGDGSTLHLGPGDYPVSRTLVVTGGVHIVSDAGPESTSIYRVGPYGKGAAFRILVADSPNFVLSGVTVSNSYANVCVASALALNGGTATNCVFARNYLVPHSYGGGVVFAKGGRIVDCRFIDNYGSGGMGGAVILHGATMENCLLLRNRNPNANNGSSQVFAHENAIIRRCRLIGNMASGGGCGGALHVAEQNVLVENCLFACNTNYWYNGNCTGGITLGANGTRIVNCTVVANSSNNGGIFANAKSAVLVNTLFADNIGKTADAASQGIASRDNVLFTNCLFAAQGTISGANYVNCRAGAPAFTDPAALDYTLTSSSPAVDKGAATPWSEDPPLDLAGNGRVRNVVDIGCYEFYPAATLDAAYTVSGNDVAGGEVTFEAIVTGADLDGLECRWRLVDGAGNGTWTAWLDGTTYSPVSPAPGRYTLELEVRNGNGEEAASDMGGAAFVIAAPEVFVAPRTLEGHVAAEPYATRATAATNLAHVAEFCGTGTKVTLLDGDHAVPDPVSFDCAVTIASDGGDPARCSLYRPGGFEAGTQYRLVSLLAGGSFTAITVSNAYNIGETTLASGLYAYQVAVSNCVFHRCSGTAAFNDGGTFRKCLFTENKGHSPNGSAFMQRGAAALAEDCVFTRGLPGTYHQNSTVRCAGGRFIRCAVTDNDLVGTATAGTLSNGGFYITDGCVLDNCLIAGNHARTSTGALCVYIADANSPCVLVNCTIADNSVVDSTVSTMPVGGYSRVYATNCIFHANTRQNGSTTPAFSQGGGTRLYLVNCLADDTTGATSAAGCFSDNPRFRNAAGGDYTLMSKSPCVGKGAAYDFAGVTDLAGNPRLFGPAVDIGCYELTRGLGSVLQLR